MMTLVDQAEEYFVLCKSCAKFYASQGLFKDKPIKIDKSDKNEEEDC